MSLRQFISISKFQQYCREHVIYLVPTMGCLHQGHIELIKQAQQQAQQDDSQKQIKIVVTIFVNPIQFDNKNDLANYAQPIQEDLALLKKLAVDAVLTPQTDTIYPSKYSTYITETRLSLPLCGNKRAGHFDGVCTIVLRLLLLSSARKAFFGLKDLQQYHVIHKMCQDLHVNTTICPVPIYRQTDGLAYSSRNLRLSARQKQYAPAIYRGLSAAKIAILDGDITSDISCYDWLHNYWQSLLNNKQLAVRIDYIHYIDCANLQPIMKSSIPPANWAIAVAVYFGKVRLIDNITA